MVSTLSSGRGGEPPKAPALISVASYTGLRSAMASAALIGRNVGGSLRVAATTASAVIGLLTGPTARMASTLLSRIAAATLLGSNWTMLTLSGAFFLPSASVLSMTTL